MQYKILQTKLSASEGERAVIARISTTSVDRDGDVMLPSGVDLSDFTKNPVVLFGHDSNRIPVGRAVAIHRRAQDIVAKVQFAERPKSLPDMQEWVPDTIFSLFQQKILNAFSVGFTIQDSRPATKHDIARFGDGVRQIITKWNLLEFSVVPVPANQDALAVAVSKGYVKESSWTHNELELSSVAEEVTMYQWDTPGKYFVRGCLA
jgi:HK97 family phage prohead protease